MSLSNPKTAISEQDLKDFYDKIKPFLAPKTYAGFTPIGTIISIFGESAPANYLICDGATYNVADYPELCAHLWSLTTNSQYKVDGDATKFKVPDLRGEFLRGTGTNGHTENGNGANVGVHQNTSYIHNIQISTGDKVIQIKGVNSDFGAVIDNTDTSKLVTSTNTKGIVGSSGRNSTESSQYERFGIRPTNTSVLFCIATKNIYLDPKNDYSTDEKVIGTWVDGRTLHQKTINFGALPNATRKSVTHGISNLDKIIEMSGYFVRESDNLSFPLPFVSDNIGSVQLTADRTSVTIGTMTDRSTYTDCYITLRYVKTT